RHVPAGRPYARPSGRSARKAVRSGVARALLADKSYAGISAAADSGGRHGGLAQGDRARPRPRGAAESMAARSGAGVVAWGPRGIRRGGGRGVAALLLPRASRVTTSS